MSLPRGTLVIVDLEPPWLLAPMASPNLPMPWWISCARSTSGASAAATAR